LLTIVGYVLSTIPCVVFTQVERVKVLAIAKIQTAICRIGESHIVIHPVKVQPLPKLAVKSRSRSGGDVLLEKRTLEVQLLHFIGRESSAL
jgi:hypothetical protein